MNKIPVGSPTSWGWGRWNLSQAHRGAVDKIMVFKGPAADPVEEDKPAAGATLTVAETQVFSGTIPSSWTDLNLSGIIGSQESIVLLKIKVSTARFVAFRKNGDTDEFYCASDYPGGCAFFRSYSGEHKVVVVATDAAGIVEWRSTGAATATVDIIAYLK